MQGRNFLEHSDIERKHDRVEKKNEGEEGYFDKIVIEEWERVCVSKSDFPANRGQGPAGGRDQGLS